MAVEILKVKLRTEEQKQKQQQTVNWNQFHKLKFTIRRRNTFDQVSLKNLEFEEAVENDAIC